MPTLWAAAAAIAVCLALGTSVQAQEVSDDEQPAAPAAASTEALGVGSLAVLVADLVGMEGLELAGGIPAAGGVGFFDAAIPIDSSPFTATPQTTTIAAGTHTLDVFAGQPPCVYGWAPVCGGGGGTEFACAIRFDIRPDEDLSIVISGLPDATWPERAPCPVLAVRHSPVPSPPPPSTAEPFDLVWFGDSSAAFARPMAQRIEQALGVEVRVHDFWGGGHLGSAAFIADLIEIQAVEDALKEAEMIVLYANPGGTKPFDDMGPVCFAPEAPPDEPPTVPSTGDLAPYAERLRAIYDRILMLRAGEPVIIRAVDAYVPVLGLWRSAGVEEACTAMWETWTGVARDVAASYGVPMASMYDAFNGPGHDADPVEAGYIGPDRIHPSDAGRAAQVDLLDALGYAPVEHP